MRRCRTMRESRVALVCPACGSRALCEPADIAAKLRRHNRELHDGAAVASVAGGHVDRLGVADD
jgi:hypothetical protein